MMDQSDNESENSPKPKKWVPRPLVRVCGVCGSPATDVQHYGATACYSCRAFFRRCIGAGKEYRNCSRKTDRCVVDAVNRTNCKKCRFQKCLKVGMKPEKVDRIRRKAKFDKVGGNDKKVEKTEQVEEVAMFHDDKQNSSENSEDSDPDASIDICALVEECIYDEMKSLDDVEYINLSITVDKEDSSEKMHNKQESLLTQDTDQCEIQNLSVIIPSSPVINFTFEEDFKIHELLVRKENLLDGIFQTFMNHPGSLPFWEQFLKSVDSKERVYAGIRTDITKTLRKNIIANFMNGGGLVRQSLDMFDEYKNVDESVKTETFLFSISVFLLVIRSTLLGNKNKKTFVTQHQASGTFTNSFREACLAVFPDKIDQVSSFDPRKAYRFTSPWAAKLEDEEFFSRTLETVGSIIKDDVKLGTLYCTLLLATPGQNLSQASLTNHSLHKVQQEMRFLMFRYLSNKYGNSQYASNTANALIKLLEDLHLCRQIHLFKRLNGSTFETFKDSIEDIVL